MKSLFIPAKTFLWGEYSALVGGPALLMAHSPYFQALAGPPKGLLPFHPQSAVARYLARSADPRITLYQVQSLANLGGGWGLSSAEFVAAYALSLVPEGLEPKGSMVQESDFFAIQKVYQNLFIEKNSVPSGYDVLAQWWGGFLNIQAASHHWTQKDFWPLKRWGFVLIATHQKMPTHQHLAEDHVRAKAHIIETQAQVLQRLWDSADPDYEAWIYQLTKFRFHLQSLGLEAPGTTRTIEILQQAPGYVFAKGCGAMGQDVIWALYKQEEEVSFLKYLNKCNITVVADHREVAKGVRHVDWTDLDSASV